MTIPIKSQVDWWNEVNIHWDAFMECFANTGANMLAKDWPNIPEGSGMVEHDVTLGQFLIDARDRKDHKLIHTYFEYCWSVAPDSSEIHSWPRWASFCDICSEYWVFEEESQLEEVANIEAADANQKEATNDE